MVWALLPIIGVMTSLWSWPIRINRYLNLPFPARGSIEYLDQGGQFLFSLVDEGVPARTLLQVIKINVTNATQSNVTKVVCDDGSEHNIKLCDNCTLLFDPTTVCDIAYDGLVAIPGFFSPSYMIITTVLMTLAISCSSVVIQARKRYWSRKIRGLASLSSVVDSYAWNSMMSRNIKHSTMAEGKRAEILHGLWDPLCPFGEKPDGWDNTKTPSTSKVFSENREIHYKSLIANSHQSFEKCIYEARGVRRFPCESVRDFLVVRVRQIVPELKTLDHRLDEYINTHERACFSPDEFTKSEYEQFNKVLGSLETYMKSLAVDDEDLHRSYGLPGTPSNMPMTPKQGRRRSGTMGGILFQ